MEFRSTGDGRVAHVKSCVLYDADGVIQHVHHVVDMEGVEETPESVVAERALALARDRGLDYAALRTLHVDPSLDQRPGAHAGRHLQRGPGDGGVFHPLAMVLTDRRRLAWLCGQAGVNLRASGCR